MTVRDQMIQHFLGKRVHVEVDRPIGYRHGDLVYPVNYGFLPGVMAPDGEEQDVYILGVEEPVSGFDGTVIGAVRRHNDCEDKLVAAPEGMLFHQAEIAQAVHFQEQFFSYSIASMLRKSCGVIPYRKNRGKTEFLILLQRNRCWSFPKGHMEAGETEQETALRELKEETGLHAVLQRSGRVELSYRLSAQGQKQLVLFPGEVSGEIRIQPEEAEAFRWVRLEELSEYLMPDTLSACAQVLKTI